MENLTLETTSGAASGRAPLPLAAFLDRLIVLLMLAILLTLTWPVGVAFYQSGHTSPVSSQPVLRSKETVASPRIASNLPY